MEILMTDTERAVVRFVLGRNVVSESFLLKTFQRRESSVKAALTVMLYYGYITFTGRGRSGSPYTIRRAPIGTN
jgi:hypothetical protein